MNILSKTIFFSSLFSLFSIQTVWAESSDDGYMNALSGEAGQTSMKDDDTTKSAQQKSELDEAATAPKQKTETIDNNKLTDKVSQQLEKLLVGSNNGDVKQEDLANIVSVAVQAGHEIDNIHEAVTNAMTELREKEGIDIKAEVLEFSIKSVNEIVAASKNVASGDVEDPYIQSLKAEAEASNTSTSDDTEATEESTATVSTETNKEDKTDSKTTTANNVSTETAKTDKDKEEVTGTATTDTVDTADKKDDTIQTEKSAKEDSSSAPKTRTIIVLKGESLSKIAEKIYGSSRKYTLLYEANKETLKDPNNIHIGQILKVPLLVEEEG